MRRYLSLPEKRTFLKLIAFRDGGYRCLYCKIKLTPRTLIYEHLNDSWWDNRVDNLAFSCQSCNIKKANGDRRIGNLAEAKLEDNQKKSVGEKFPDLENEEDEKVKGSKEIDINEKSWDITEEYIRDQVMKNSSISYNDTLNSCVYLCKKKTGHGSNNTIRRHIDAFCSPAGPFENQGRGRNRVIVRRISTDAPAEA